MLEIAIQENTAALRELLAALKAGVPTTPAVAQEVKAQEVVKESKKSAPVEKPASSPSGATPPTVVDTAAPAAEVDYEAIKRPFLALVNTKGRDAAAALLAQFGVDAGKGGKLSDIPADKYADVLAAIEVA